MLYVLAAVALLALMKLLDYAFDKWLFGGERRNHAPKLDPSGVLWMEVKRGELVPAALRNVLLGLQGQG